MTQPITTGVVAITVITTGILTLSIWGMVDSDLTVRACASLVTIGFASILLAITRHLAAGSEAKTGVKECLQVATACLFVGVVAALISIFGPYGHDHFERSRNLIFWVRITFSATIIWIGSSVTLLILR